MTRTLALPALLLALAATGVQAQKLYKWVDEKGKTHYTETPPPGKRAQEMRRDKPAPGPAEAARKPAAEAKKQVVAARPNPALLAERNSLLGSWATPLTATVQISIVLAPSNPPAGPALLVGQRWLRGDKMAFKSNVEYTVRGGKGRGFLEATEAGMAGVPARINYHIESNALVLSVNDGVYSGEHRLTRQK